MPPVQLPPSRPDDPPSSLPGYGVRLDLPNRRYLVRNELTGEWLRDASGGLRSYTSFTVADFAWRSHQPRSRAVF